MITSALQWIGDSHGYLELVDQRLLPGRFEKLPCRETELLYDAIKTLAVRGAPAIGVAAGYGLVLALQNAGDRGLSQALRHLQEQAAYLATSRPTAVNLFWALNRVQQKAEAFVTAQPQAQARDLLDLVWTEAQAICEEDIVMCARIGQHGVPFIKDGSGVLTHCNAGALATAGQGTALSLFFAAHQAGRQFTVYADETRPLLQGARLTAWELQQADIPCKLICDNMAGWVMKQGLVQAVVTGADRIAANGDAANKIGTYSLSILARKHDIPFYIAAPSSTFDLSIGSGTHIEIEQRSPQEVTHIQGVQTAPEGIDTFNPAFDVTDATHITAIVTERGVIERPTEDKIREHLK
jgi:methylthioribose-1-phosphate isomerase